MDDFSDDREYLAPPGGLRNWCKCHIQVYVNFNLDVPIANCIVEKCKKCVSFNINNLMDCVVEISYYWLCFGRGVSIPFISTNIHRVSKLHSEATAGQHAAQRKRCRHSKITAQTNPVFRLNKPVKNYFWYQICTGHCGSGL